MWVFHISGKPRRAIRLAPLAQARLWGTRESVTPLKPTAGLNGPPGVAWATAGPTVLEWRHDGAGGIHACRARAGASAGGTAAAGADLSYAGFWDDARRFRAQDGAGVFRSGRIGAAVQPGVHYGEAGKGSA